MNTKLLLSLILLAALDSAFAAPAEKSASNSETAHIEQMIARFVPTDITADISKLSPNDRRVLAKAGRSLEDHRRDFPAPGLERKCLDAARSFAGSEPEGRARLHYFVINKGPWSRLDEDKPFVLGAPAKPQERRVLSR